MWRREMVEARYLGKEIQHQMEIYQADLRQLGLSTLK